MKKLGVLMMAMAFLVIMVVGKMYWNHKIAKATDVAAEQKTEARNAGSSSVNLAYTKNLPQEVQEKLHTASKENPVHLVIAGDEASQAKGWPAQLKKQLDKEYGKHIWKVTVLYWEEESTQDMLANQRYNEMIAAKPDVLLFEVPLLTDNQENGNLTSMQNTEAILNFIKEPSDCTVLLQPSNPIYKAKNYPKAVEALKQFASINAYTYLDHWSAWPNPDTEEIKSYLTKEIGFPNEQGYKLWGNYLINYFIAK
jgi:hypothetical protein